MRAFPNSSPDSSSRGGPGSLLALGARGLSDRLKDLVGTERDIQADFLLHLAALDTKRWYAELGYPSLWEYCLRALHLREGAAGRRIGAMRVLRRFPQLEPDLRSGRLCLSTLCALSPVLTPENVADLAEKAAFKTKAEVDELVVALKPRPAPADGLRRLPTAEAAVSGALALAAVNEPASARQAELVGVPVVPTLDSVTPTLDSVTPALNPVTPALESVTPAIDPVTPAVGRLDAGAASSRSASAANAQLTVPDERRPAVELRPVAAEQWSLRVTLDAEAKRDLETLACLLGHKIPRRDVAAVLKEALRCAVEEHSRRRGKGLRKTARAVAQGRDRRGEAPAAAPPSDAPLSDAPSSDAAREKAARDPLPRRNSPRTPAKRRIPASVKREVWERDGGRCTYVAEDGTRCESRWQLELDHLDPYAEGQPTAKDLCLSCRPHNFRNAEAVYGREHMENFLKRRRIGGGAAGGGDGAAGGSGDSGRTIGGAK
jgi:5-methylcytosine-specific restriction endonuclease McrA